MKEFLTYWQFDSISLAIIWCMLIYYGITTKFRAGKNRYFFTALILAILCFFSPLQVLSTHYLFSAHMLVHVILLLLVGPLLMLSIPENSLHSYRLLYFVKQHPLAGWLTGVGVMWVWHIPVLFNAMMESPHELMILLHGLEEISLIAAGIVFSAPVIHPNKKFRIDALQAVVYLFTACIGCSVLGLLITFAPLNTYRHYLAFHDPRGLNPVITGQWRITQVADQQAAGLIMWVPCCFIYVSGAMYLLIRWFGQKEDISIQFKKV